MKALFFLILSSLCVQPLTAAQSAPTKVAPPSAGTDIDKDLSKQIFDVLTECQKIKPGMTRAELSKVFTTEGGLSTAERRIYVYRDCQNIKVMVDFTLSEPKQNVLEERPTDIISKISNPCLEWSIVD